MDRETRRELELLKRGFRLELDQLREDMRAGGMHPSERPPSLHDIEETFDRHVKEITGSHDMAALRRARDPVFIIVTWVGNAAAHAAKHVITRWVAGVLGGAAAAKVLHELHWIRWW